LSVGNPVIGQEGTQVREVEQITLDGFLAEHLGKGRSVDLLKVDVEGYELEVFKGAPLLLAQHRPLIFCEIEKRHNAGYLELFLLLEAAGYRSFIFQEGRFRLFTGEITDELQSAQALAARLDGSYDPAKNLYINNFIFQHPRSRIKVSAT